MPDTPRPPEMRVCPDILFDIDLEIIRNKRTAHQDLTARIIVQEVNQSELVDIQSGIRL